MTSQRLHLQSFSRVIVALIIALFATIGLAVTPASAHDQLINTTPKAGASLKSAPTKVTLTFNESVLKIGSAVRVVRSGHNYAAGKAKVSGTQVTQKLESNLPSGKYRVTWRVVSADGHPVGAKYTFTVRAQASATPATSSVATPNTAAAAATSTSTPATSPASNGMPGWVWTIIVAIVGLAVLVSVVTWLGRRK